MYGPDVPSPYVYFKESYHAPGADVSLVLYASTHRIGQNWVPQKVDTKDEVTSVVPQVVNIEPCHFLKDMQYKPSDNFI